MCAMRKTLDITTWSLVLVLVCPRLAHAYIDPGAGSYIAQAVVAALVTGGFLVKLFAARVRAAIARLFSRKEH